MQFSLTVTKDTQTLDVLNHDPLLSLTPGHGSHCSPRLCRLTEGETPIIGALMHVLAWLEYAIGSLPSIEQIACLHTPPLDADEWETMLKGFPQSGRATTQLHSPGIAPMSVIIAQTERADDVTLSFPAKHKLHSVGFNFDHRRSSVWATCRRYALSYWAQAKP